MNNLVDPKALVKSSQAPVPYQQTSLRAQAGPQGNGAQFQRALNQVQQNPAGTNPAAQAGSVAVQPGDTLSGLVRSFMSASGKPVSSGEAMRLAQDVARNNNLPNANLIFPGQRIHMGALQEALKPDGNVANANNTTYSTSAPSSKAPVAGVATASANLAAKATSLNATLPPPAVNGSNDANAETNQSGVNATAQVQLLARGNTVAHPVLDKTLDRAVSKGFIPEQDKNAVRDKILSMARDHKFKPDDFARMTLMESDGMNPRSTNNRCHGIIQFCDGPDRGAASAGFGSNPRAILNHSVLQQLDMVGKYFDETGLKNYGPAGLDDLYLTVLTPAARTETRTDVGLNIAGPQAPALHVNRDTKAPITRTSLLQGLYQNAIDRLGLRAGNKADGNSPQAALSRAQALRVSAYQSQIPDDVR